MKGVPSTQAGHFRQIVTQQFSNWMMTPLNSTDYRLTLKPTEAIAMRQQILAQTQNTFEKENQRPGTVRIIRPAAARRYRCRTAGAVARASTIRPREADPPNGRCAGAV